MPINGYLGGVISATAPSVTTAGASGVFTLEEQFQAAGQNNWPGYQISRSVRFRASASAYFSRTPSSASNRSTWTYSAWIKKAPIDFNTSMSLLSAGSFGSDLFTIQITDNGLSVPCITVYGQISGSAVLQVSETPARRDPSAWFHMMVVLDTTQATASDRVKIYYNGAQVTALTTATYPNQNTTFAINNNQATAIGSRAGGSAPFYDGYMTEVNFIDGQALTPASFGAFDALTGVWNPIRYSGTYGNNGFYLNFSDNSSNTATTIGKDYSGNGNNWTPNNISVTAGTTYDSMVDVPIGYGSDTGVGGELRGNYAVFNPLDFKGSNAPTLSFANMRINAVSTAAWRASASTIAFSSQKIYCEITLNGAGSTSGGSRTFGVIAPSSNIGASGVGFASNTGWGIAATTGTNDGAWTNGSKTTLTGITTASGTVYQIAVDGTVGSGSNKIWFGQNGTWFNSGVPSSGTNPVFSNLPSDMQFIAAILTDSGYDLDVNFGQRAFSYTAPSGFKALCTQNLPTPTVNNGANYMAATLYTGTGASLAVTNTVNGISFAPDFVWAKGRSVAYSHGLYDTIRGATKKLSSNSSGAEVTDTQGLTAFNSNGFTLGTDAGTNQNAATYVGWQWKGGGTAVTNTAGSLTSSVSANTTAGFSIVTYTGTIANATVGHGLGVAPQMIIARNRSNVVNWIVYHVGLTSASYYLTLDEVNAQTNNSIFWQGVAPTSTVFSLGANSSCNGTSSNVAYCFAPIAGYSAFGSYTGNGSTDGPFVYTGMRVRWLMIKRSSSASVTYGWQMYDTSRQPYNTASSDPNLWADTSAAEGTGNYTFDLLSNGFKLRSSGVNENASGDTYIYAAFAENPFNISRAR